MWVVVTLVAVVLQALRTSMQQKLRSQLSITAAGFVRYFYGAPLALAAVGIAVIGFGQKLEAPPPTFWVTVTAAGVAQIVGTVALITAFDRRGFAVGTVYAKTEVLQVAVFSALVLHEQLGLWGWAGAGVCLVGVAWLALARPRPVPGGSAVLGGRAVLGGLAVLGRPALLGGSAVKTDGLATQKRQGTQNPGPIDPGSVFRVDAAFGFGLLAGAGFALASVWIRASSKSLGDHPAVFRALLTLAAMNTIQMVINGTQMLLTNADDVRAVVHTWRSSSAVGLLSVCGSAGWALAVTLQTATKVRTLGQVELLLTFAISHRFLGERHRRNEYLASALVVAGVGIVLALG